MKKNQILLFSLFILSITNCGSDNGFGGPGVNPSELPLITGNTDQPNVTYNNNVPDANFEQVSTDGDSTFFEAGFDFNGNNSNDLVFTLVKWADRQVLTVRSRNGFEIPFSGSEFEIFGTEQSILGVDVLNAGIEINNFVTNYTGLSSGFLTNTTANAVNTSANMIIWNGVGYLPFRNGNSSGWLGFRIISNVGVQIGGISVTTLAIRP